MARKLQGLFLAEERDLLLQIDEHLRRGDFNPAIEQVGTSGALGAALDRGGVDLILADHDWIRAEPLKLLQQLDQRGLDLPVIVISRDMSQDEAVRLMQVGVHDYVRRDHLARLVPAVVRELREAEGRRERWEVAERFRTLAEQSPNMIFINRGGRVVYINRRCVEVLGYTAEELYAPGFDYRILFGKESLPAIQDASEKHEGSEDIAPYECTLITKAGEALETVISTRLIRYRGGPALLGVVTDISQQKRAEDALYRRLYFESFISRISSEFVNAPVERIDQAIESALEGLAEFADAAYGLVFVFSEDLSQVDLSHEWHKPGTESYQETLGRFPPEMFAYCWTRLQRKESVFMGRLEDLPGEARGEKKWGMRHGFRPTLLVPLLLKGRLYGALGLTGLPGDKWTRSDDLVELLQFVTDIVVNALERKRVEEALKESEARYKAVSELTSDYAYRYRVEGDGELVNEWVTGALSRITGFTADEVRELGGWERLVHPDDLPIPMGQLKAVLQGKSATVEYRIRTKSGEIRWMRDFAQPRWDKEQSRTTHVHGAVQDITEERLALENTADRERFLANVFSSIQDGISILDREMNILRVNPTMERWYSHALPLAGKKCYEAYHGRSERCATCPTYTTLRTGEASYEIVPKTGPGGKPEGWMDLFSHPLVDSETGELTGVIEYVRDISDRKQLEEQLQMSQKMESVGRLAGGIAHDFNNLLGIVTGFSDLILHGLSEGDPLRRDVNEILKAAKQASGLTRQLLAFSRRQVLQPSVFNLNRVVRGMEQMLRRLIGEDIELFVSLHPGMGNVRFDPGLVEQVVMNLVVNARDAMPGGGRLMIETGHMEVGPDLARRHAGATAGPHVVLSVTDNGVGMDADTLARIFDPFFTTKEPGKGTGLGLSTVYGIIRQSGGFIQVESSPGRGTTFGIHLPEVDEEAEGEPAEEVTVVRGTETVLVVEDEEMLLDLISRMLQINGYRVLKARHGGEALLLCEKNQDPIHLLLTDVVMPQLSGREMANRLAGLHPEMKVLYMSGYTDDAIIHHGVLEEGMPFIQKPFSAATLAARVRQVLDG